MGENHSFWLLKRFLIFQGISGDLDVNVLEHMTHSQMLGKFEYTRGPIFKVVLEC